MVCIYEGQLSVKCSVLALNVLVKLVKHVLDVLVETAVKVDRRVCVVHFFQLLQQNQLLVERVLYLVTNILRLHLN